MNLKKEVFPAASHKKDDALMMYFKQIKAIPLLSFEEEQELSERRKLGDETARTRLIEANLRLVVKIAQTYLRSDVPLMDIIQEGNVGLMYAADKYDGKKKVRFASYANWWIRQAIVRSLSNNGRTIYLPHRKEEMLRKVQKAYHRLGQTLMRRPKLEEIATEIGFPVEDIALILNLTNGLLPLETENSEDESLGVIDMHEDYTYSPERAFFKHCSLDDARRILAQLPDREKRILMYRYELNGCKRYTLKKISAKLGISPESVRQIEIKTIQKIRRIAADFRDSIYIEAI
ncbi:MAG: RNA polymerase sigma factor RpoD/SigA [Treponema sp.]|nr:RNA polymerase sigma factor RpoD/SigA [Treponema sp.]